MSLTTWQLFIIVGALLFCFFLWLFRESIGQAISGGRTSFKIGKTGIDFELVAATSAANLSLAVAKSETAGAPSSVVPDDKGDQIFTYKVENIAMITTKASQSRSSLGDALVLWVDDNPGNNVYERNALKDLGIKFELAKSTDEAMRALAQPGKKYSLVISDFSRRDDAQGGFTLLDEIKSVQPPPPLIIYSANANPTFVQMAKARGAYGETNNPIELYDMVVKSILQGSV